MDVDARTVASLLLSYPHVRDLHAGPLGTIATATADEWVPGVLITPGMIMLGLVVAADVDRERLADQIRTRLAGSAPGVAVSMSIISANEESRATTSTHGRPRLDNSGEANDSGDAARPDDS